MGFTDRQIIIVQTMVMKFDQKNSLAYLKTKGYKIAQSTLEKEKKKIIDGTDKRKFDLMQTGLWQQHCERIDQLETANKLAWENYHKEKDAYKKVKILAIISSIQPLLSSYYSLSQRVIENDAELKKLQG